MTDAEIAELRRLAEAKLAATTAFEEASVAQRERFYRHYEAAKDRYDAVVTTSSIIVLIDRLASAEAALLAIEKHEHCSIWAVHTAGAHFAKWEKLDAA